MRNERDYGSSGTGFFRGGCSGCGCVLTAGIALSIFGAAIGFGCSARIPFTESNVSIAGSIGDKDLNKIALPNYVSSRLGSNEDFINSSSSLTIGPAEGSAILVIGEQGGVPAIDLFIAPKRK